MLATNPPRNPLGYVFPFANLADAYTGYNPNVADQQFQNLNSQPLDKQPKAFIQLMVLNQSFHQWLNCKTISKWFQTIEDPIVLHWKSPNIYLWWKIPHYLGGNYRNLSLLLYFKCLMKFHKCWCNYVVLACCTIHSMASPMTSGFST